MPTVEAATVDVCDQRKLELAVAKTKNNVVVSKQLAVVNQTDQYLDLDQKIEDNHRKQIMDKGWTRSRISAAKMPPSQLFRRADTFSRATGTTREHTTLAGNLSHANLRSQTLGRSINSKPGSRGTYRPGKSHR